MTYTAAAFAWIDSITIALASTTALRLRLCLCVCASLRLSGLLQGPVSLRLDSQHMQFRYVCVSI